MKRYIVKSIALMLALNCGGMADAADRSNLRGERYGEVLLGKGGLITPKEFDVYNTIGLNDCPEELWSKLDADKIKTDTGSKIVKLNGPRYWTIDGITGSSLVNPEPRDFGGIAMRLAGVLELSLTDKLNAGVPYAVHKVARTTTWVFDAGKPVYQLIDPSGNVYFMQSYSVQKKKDQTVDSLAKLGANLKLPQGWKFRTVTLRKPYDLKALDGMAYVIQDDFENTYQRSAATPGDDL
ncbi:MAG: hypothetical protein K2W95_18625 [Candidatus Obscuribacterales bacterium]|nr:hypothetical protein [Candidatus Obscuribacterales bacterium]